MQWQRRALPSDTAVPHSAANDFGSRASVANPGNSSSSLIVRCTSADFGRTPWVARSILAKRRDGLIHGLLGPFRLACRCGVMDCVPLGKKSPMLVDRRSGATAMQMQTSVYCRFGTNSAEPGPYLAKIVRTPVDIGLGARVRLKLARNRPNEGPANKLSRSWSKLQAHGGRRSGAAPFRSRV